MGPHGDSWGPMGTHGDPWEPMGTHGNPWKPMGSHGSPWVPWDPMWSPWGPHGPMASMENPRMSKIMDFNETHYSVRQNGGSTGSSSIRNMFPLHPVTSKRPESPYGAIFCFDVGKSSFSSFRRIVPLLDPYWTLYRGPLTCQSAYVSNLPSLNLLIPIQAPTRH